MVTCNPNWFQMNKRERERFLETGLGKPIQQTSRKTTCIGYVLHCRVQSGVEGGGGQSVQTSARNMHMCMYIMLHGGKV